VIKLTFSEAEIVPLVLLGLVVSLGEDKEIYRGCDRNEGSEGSLKLKSESASTIHFILGLKFGS
jgi:hypothetical protein